MSSPGRGQDRLAVRRRTLFRGYQRRSLAKDLSALGRVLDEARSPKVGERTACIHGSLNRHGGTSVAEVK